MKSFIFAISLATAVLYTTTAAAGERHASERQVPFTTIAQGNLSGVKHQMDVVIRDPMEFEMLWRHHSEGTPVAEPMPKVDFTTEVVVGLFLGNAYTCGYDVAVTEVEDRVTHTRVESKILVPGGPIMCLMIEQPYQLIKLARDAAKVITFKQGVEIR